MAIQLIDTVTPDIGLKTVADKINNNFTDANNAASRLVTSSATDTTEGRLLKVGDSGLTGRDILPVCLDVDDKTLSRGKYYVSNPSGTLPIGLGGFGMLEVDTVADPDAILHTLTQQGTAGTEFKRFYRLWHNDDASPSAWVEVLHTGNTIVDTNGFIKQA